MSVAKSDKFRNPLYSTGSGWSAVEAEAIVVANANDASWVCHDVLLNAVCNRACHRFVVPLIVELSGEKPSMAGLRHGLEQSMRIVVDSPRHIFGPKGTVGVIAADVDETKNV